MLRSRGIPPGITTRRYPVDLDKLSERLDQDLPNRYDAILHLGQAPGTSAIHLESIAINVAGVTQSPGLAFGPLIAGAPVAYQSRCPVGRMSAELHAAGIPASISYHAGTYLCNALMYLTHHWHAARGTRCLIGFAHLPLTIEQTLRSHREMPGLAKADLARGIEVMLGVLQASAREEIQSQIA